MSTLGTRIRKRREELNLSREQVADRMRALGHSVRQQQIYRWETKGVVGSSRAVTILERALDLPPGYLGHGESAGKTSLAFSDLLRLLDELSATPAERDHLTRHLESREAEHETLTPTYVRGYLRGIRDSRNSRAAQAEAMTAEAREQIRAEGWRKPLSDPK